MEGSAQVAELAAVVRALDRFPGPLNIVTDSAYVAGVVIRAQDAWVSGSPNPKIQNLLSTLVQRVSHRKSPIFIMHIRSHTDLPGFITEGNKKADTLAAPIHVATLPDRFQQAKLSHSRFHQNAPALVRMFNLTRDQARAVVATCPNCQPSQLPSLGSGVNPRGLGSGELWQMDVTHVPEFGRQKYVHVCVDTFSGAVFASARTGEKAKDVTSHLIQAFAVLGIPREIKTDNGPAYVSGAVKKFFQEWGISHTTGIPHSATGQALVERTHQNIKRMLSQQRGGSETEAPSIRLARALFTLNFLNCSEQEPDPPVLRHFHCSTRARLKEHPLVFVKEPDSLQVKGPYPLLTWGRGYGCVTTPTGPRWFPAKYVKPCLQNPPASPSASRSGRKDVTWRRRQKSPKRKDPQRASESTSETSSDEDSPGQQQKAKAAALAFAELPFPHLP